MPPRACSLHLHLSRAQELCMRGLRQTDVYTYAHLNLGEFLPCCVKVLCFALLCVLHYPVFCTTCSIIDPYIGCHLSMKLLTCTTKGNFFMQLWLSNESGCMLLNMDAYSLKSGILPSPTASAPLLEFRKQLSPLHTR